MHGLIVTGLLVVAAAGPAVQSKKDPTPTPKDAAVTLSGCVSAKPASDGDFTLTDTFSGSRYRLTGKEMKSFAGQRVEIVSPKGGGLTVRGGLAPSANVAAQAGHIDSAQAAIAGQPGVHNTGKSGEKLPEFRVGTVRAVEGTCK
jgi:hypothetical protein